MTLHTSEKYSKKNINVDKDQVLNQLILKFCKLYGFNKSDIIYKNIHKWRFAKVENPLSFLAFVTFVCNRTF